MSKNTKPPFGGHLRSVDMPSPSRLPAQRGRANLKIADATTPDAPAPWALNLIDELQRKTNHGRDGSTIFSSIPVFPDAEELQTARDFMAVRGIKVELTQTASPDGTFSAWVNYYRDS